jgi:preprotein translocase subunit SecA
LPKENQRQIQEAREVKSKQKLNEQKDEIENLDQRSVGSKAAGQIQNQPSVTETITREMPKIGRNDKVTIKHVMSGETKQVKYKQAIPLITKGEWVLTQ